MQERNYDYLVKFPAFDEPIDTIAVDIICFDPLGVSNKLHISAIIHLCNIHKIKHLRLYSSGIGRGVDIKYICSLFDVGASGAGKFNNTIKYISAESNREDFFCNILSKFVKRSRATRIMCKFFDLEAINVAKIKRYVIKEENRYLREIKFEKAHTIYLDDLVDIDNYPMKIYTEYNISYLNSGDGVEDELADNIMHRNRKNFETMQSRIIPILALSKYKGRCGLKQQIHKDVILMVAKMTWYTSIP